jgi:hypothetical protein
MDSVTRAILLEKLAGLDSLATCHSRAVAQGRYVVAEIKASGINQAEMPMPRSDCAKATPVSGN